MDYAIDYASLPLVTMLIGLTGGLALFLHGMTMMSTAMRAMAGSRLKTKDLTAHLGAFFISLAVKDIQTRLQHQISGRLAFSIV